MKQTFKRSKLKLSSSFKKALKKLNSTHSHSKACKMLRNSSDYFLRDLAMATQKCLPGIEPLISKKAKKDLKRFSSSKTSLKSRRRMVDQRGGGFLDFLMNVASNVWHALTG